MLNSLLVKSMIKKEIETEGIPDTEARKEIGDHTGNTNNPHKVTKVQVGLEKVDNTSDVDKPVSTEQQKAIDSAKNNANEYTDQKIADLINGAPTTLDTLKEIADAMDENQDVVKALDESIGTKANASDLTEHTSNTNNPHSVTKEQLGLGNAVESEVATDFSEAETPKFQQTIDDVLYGVNELKGDLENNYIGYRRYLDNNDDCFNLVPGVYGISNKSQYRPKNLPDNFSENAAGFLVVLQRFDSNGVNLAFAFQLYEKKMWMYTGFGWEEVSKTSYVDEKINDALKINVPDYYYADNYFQNKLLDIRNEMNFSNGICFAFITDTHFPINAGKSKVLLREIFNKTNVPFCIFGGDAISNLYGDETFLNENIDTLISYSNIFNSDQWFAVLGNHDLYSREEGTPYVYHRLNSNEIYNIMMRRSERHVTNMNNEHLCYCLDIPSQKTRFIMLNSTDMTVPNGYIQYSNDQLKWLINVLKELNDTRIIIISHCSSDPVIADSESSQVEKVQEILTAFKSKSSIIIDGETHSFLETTNTLIMQLSGHTHNDLYNVDNGILAVTTTCDASYTDDGQGMEVGTITEQAFDIFCVDYDNNTVKTVRIGRGNNRAWNYLNGNVIN